MSYRGNVKFDEDLAIIMYYECAIISKSNVNCWIQQRKVLILTSTTGTVQ